MRPQDVVLHLTICFANSCWCSEGNEGMPPNPSPMVIPRFFPTCRTSKNFMRSMEIWQLCSLVFAGIRGSGLSSLDFRLGGGVPAIPVEFRQ